VKKLFQSLPFKCNLQRYTAGSKVELTLAREDGAPTTVVVTRKKYALVPVVGLSKFANPVDP
jgi:hypothetical protein